MEDKLKLVLCKDFQLECENILVNHNWDDVEFVFVKQRCISPLETQSMSENIKDMEFENSDSFIFACDLGCLICDDSRKDSVVNQLKFIQCSHLLASPTFIDHIIGQGKYILTPGWLSKWKERLNYWGLDQKTAQLMFKDSLSSLVLIDSQINPKSKIELSDMGAYLDMPIEIIPVGLEYLELFLSKIISSWKNTQRIEKIEVLLKERNLTLADYSMAMDLLQNLSKIKDEEKAVDEIIDLFTMLFSADKVTYLPYDGEKLIQRQDHSISEEELHKIQNWMDKGSDDFLLDTSGGGFYLKLEHLDTILGILSIQKLLFPEKRWDYINLSLTIINLCGLALSNARLYQKIHEMAITDGLTQLFNRRHFYSLANIEMARSIRFGKPISVLMMDIDHFKRINDTYGHAIGDEVLVYLANLLRNHIREVDILARYGGEEFIFLLPETSGDSAEIFSNRILNMISGSSLILDSHQISLTVSIGVATTHQQELTLNELIKRSDEALYLAKDKGRNCVVVYTFPKNHPPTLTG
ncbi:MAG: diguanylate cyclase [Anaerolineaceae bacterium]|nr:diguanylate cyclase [Anaerolineaceae bacterium]